MRSVGEEIKKFMKEWDEEDLYEILYEKLARERAKVVDKLVSLRKPAVPHLLAMLEEQDTWNPLIAIDALGEIGDKRAIKPLVDMLEDPDFGEAACHALKKFGPVCIPDVIAKLRYRIANPVEEESTFVKITSYALTTIGEIRSDESIGFLNALLDDYMSEIPEEPFDPAEHDWKYRNVDFFHLLDCLVKQQDERAIPHIKKARDLFPKNYTEYTVCQLAIERIEKGEMEGYLPMDALEIAMPFETIMKMLSGGEIGGESGFNGESGEDFPLEEEWGLKVKKEIPKGACCLCGKTYTGAGMTRHLRSCLSKDVSTKPPGGNSLEKTKTFHLVISGAYLSEYWMHLEVPARATLNDLDKFLRRIWLECCGHMSAYTIEGTTYSSGPIKEYGDKSMYAKLGNVLSAGMTFHYEYDFGSTTRLVIRVASELERPVEGKLIKLLARNDPPGITCEACDNKATWVCSQCIYDDTGWLCDRCASEHECGEEMLLPVVNSPRVGTCAYGEVV